MQKGFLTATIGGRQIEHIPCPHPGVPVDPKAPPAGVLHTIEGGLGSGLAVFQQHFAPHFALDGQRIAQLIPLGMIACALENHVGGPETNHLARAQIEVAGSSQQSSWLPDADTTEVLADLLATLERAADIPLTRPFEDKMPALPWATQSFSRRSAGKWGTTSGWFGHVEVPENEHWDPGALQWTKLLARAEEIAGSDSRELTTGRQPRPTKPPKPLPDWYWVWLRWRLGEGEFKEFGPHDMGHRPELPFGGTGQAPVPAWAWQKATAFTAARNTPHP
ncbi:MAG: hypothetical protein ACXVRJ_06580 [Gaiellaceae bacterium]